jgi:tRNA (guanine37-N1)-methyltransferase
LVTSPEGVPARENAFVVDVLSLDDRPYGGGPGMVMMASPLEQAIARQKSAAVGAGGTAKVIYLVAAGQRGSTSGGLRTGGKDGAILLCGRYEGIDERLIERCVDEELSLGDFVLVRWRVGGDGFDGCLHQAVAGALNDEASAVEDSFVAGLLDCPHYTRPELYEGMRCRMCCCPATMKAIRRWRLKQALGRTWQRRPDLLGAGVE